MGAWIPRGFGLRTIKDGNTLVIETRWESWMWMIVHAGLIGVSAVAILVFIPGSQTLTPGVAKVLLIYGIAGSIVGPYTFLRGLVNRTLIHLTPERFTLKRGPLPWFGDRRFRTAEIDKVECYKRLAGSRWFSHSIEELIFPSYQMAVFLKNGNTKILYWFLSNRELGKLVAEEINETLAQYHRPRSAETGTSGAPRASMAAGAAGPQTDQSFTCSRCRVPMQKFRITQAGVTVDQCPECEILWLDRGELQAIAGKAGSLSHWSQVNLPSEEKRNTVCPRCLTAVSVIRAPDFEVSAQFCPSCSGLWLEKDQLEKILQLA